MYRMIDFCNFFAYISYTIFSNDCLLGQINSDIDFGNDARKIFCKMINDFFLPVQLDGQYSISPM